ncbi:MAG: oligosaccharide flippase family protein, partial [Actinomycetota bacterium]
SRTERGKKERSSVASMLTLSAPLWITGLCWLVIQQSDIVVLGFLRGPAEVGIYAPILKIAEASTLLLAAMAPYLLPESARLDARGDHAGLQRLYDSSTKWVLVFGTPLIAGLMLAPRELVHLLLGIDAPEVATVGRLLAAAFLLMTVFGASEALLQANCRPGKLVRRSLLVLVGTVMINVLLVWRFGIVGAALGNLLACGLFGAANAWLLHAELGVRPFSSAPGRLLAVALASSGPTALLLTLVEGQLLSIAIASAGVGAPTFIAAITPARWGKVRTVISAELNRA